MQHKNINNIYSQTILKNFAQVAHKAILIKAFTVLKTYLPIDEYAIEINSPNLIRVPISLDPRVSNLMDSNKSPKSAFIRKTIDATSIIINKAENEIEISNQKRNTIISGDQDNNKQCINELSNIDPKVYGIIQLTDII